MCLSTFFTNQLRYLLKKFSPLFVQGSLLEIIPHSPFSKRKYEDSQSMMIKSSYFKSANQLNKSAQTKLILIEVT